MCAPLKGLDGHVRISVCVQIARMRGEGEHDYVQVDDSVCGGGCDGVVGFDNGEEHGDRGGREGEGTRLRVANVHGGGWKARCAECAVSRSYEQAVCEAWD